MAKLEEIAAAGDRMVVSVDCGITALEAATRAEELGLILLVTDHHKPLQGPSGAAFRVPSSARWWVSV